ncbi:CDP-diacylglycerol--glycerol-3-phosphate 3-phosphatidyltransferase, mitochondrial-like isoform X1 [Homarus americanus]|uniref:CDP-diacylglycerol--glycerol-3-phosphate 3-phosphatidyltransferase, mitochondrial-like isoform X1 n=2 Tax=Homarus americanus TaxID=6706 RepID=UPI001C454217|nr:CDP-diacylglycerol--glycerol-3-phosphate 3-phosphatidyltransferase, mitochondrial-like isoform X1 [Homarus americanus]
MNITKWLWWRPRVVRCVYHSTVTQVLDPIPSTSPHTRPQQQHHHDPTMPDTTTLSPSHDAGEETASATTIHCPLLPTNFQWIVRHCPAFPVNGSKVRVITDPQEFYRELLSRAGSASHRISMSSLYLGTGKLEKELVSVMSERAALCKDLRVHWLLDFTRGSRGDFNSRKMLQPLVSSCPETCSVSLYHTPDLRGFLRHIIPQRWNETIGLQHMKLYVFDDSLVISGANLSNDYFTNRQDRYFVFDDCPELAQFYHTIIETVGKFSLRLRANDTTSLYPETCVHPFLSDYNKYCSSVKAALLNLWNKECSKNLSRLNQLLKSLGQTDIDKSEECITDTKINHSLDTIVFPTLQMGPFSITNDSVITKKLLTTAESNSRIQLASGYFNLTEEYMQCVLQQSQANYGILMAHPRANGFLGARGFAGAIPAAYTQLAKLFFERLQRGGASNRISMFEYQRPRWTFHAKGLWYYQPGHSLPSLTMIGSPNFGWRSVNRDLETQVIVATRNTDLQVELHHEQERLYTSSTEVTGQTFTERERLVPYWVRLVMPIIKVFF